MTESAHGEIFGPDPVKRFFTFIIISMLILFSAAADPSVEEMIDILNGKDVPRGPVYSAGDIFGKPPVEEVPDEKQMRRLSELLPEGPAKKNSSYTLTDIVNGFQIMDDFFGEGGTAYIEYPTPSPESGLTFQPEGTYTVPAETPIPEAPGHTVEGEAPEYTEPVIESEHEKASHGRSSGIRTIIAPYSLSMVDFYNGHDIPGARFLTQSVYGFAADAEFYWSPWRWISFFSDIGYSVSRKNDAVVPGGDIGHTVRLQTGADFIFNMGRTGRLGTGLFGGAAFHITAGHWNVSSIAGMRLRADWQIAPSVRLGIMSRVSLSYLDTEDPLYRSISWFIDPVALCAAYEW